MWYGFKKTSSLKRRVKNNLYRLNVRDRMIASPLPRYVSYPTRDVSLQLPLGCDFVLLRKVTTSGERYVAYIYTPTYFCNFTFRDSCLLTSFARSTQTFTFTHNFYSYYYRSYLKFVTTLFSKFNRPLFLKIKFKGKGYYIYKNSRNTIAPQMGYAHRVYVYAQAISVKFLSKTKILLFGLSSDSIFKIGFELKNVRPINIFTGRGVRFARQIVYRKTGKVSSYR